MHGRGKTVTEAIIIAMGHMQYGTHYAEETMHKIESPQTK